MDLSYVGKTQQFCIGSNSTTDIASFPGAEEGGGERVPGTHCLRSTQPPMSTLNRHGIPWRPCLYVYVRILVMSLTHRIDVPVGVLFE